MHNFYPENSLESLQAAVKLLTEENDRLTKQVEASTRKDRYQESQLRFRTVFERSRHGNKIINSDLEILQVNPAMVSLLGYDRKEDLIGTKIIFYSPKEYQKDWKLLQEKLWLRTTPSFSLETCLLKRDGTVIWCQVTSILFQDHDETFGYTIIEDITEQHKLLREKDEFISVASHELKTPITTLKATLQFVNRFMKSQTGIPKHVSDLCRKAEANTIKLAHLVSDLLNVTYIEQGGLSINKSRFLLADIIDGCCSHVQLEGKYFITYQSDHKLEVFADEHKVDQVLINLVNNAVKYAPDSLEITISSEQLSDCVKVSVSDNGPGIPPEKLAHLFDRYYRAVKKGTSQSGLGLGLYISAEIIRRHQGGIGVNSTMGQGTTFWFTLPNEGTV